MAIATIANDLTYDGEISTGAKLFTCIKSDPNDNEDNIQDIFILPEMARKWEIL